LEGGEAGGELLSNMEAGHTRDDHPGEPAVAVDGLGFGRPMKSTGTK
jgi:hypothetical protein